MTAWIVAGAFACFLACIVNLFLVARRLEQSFFYARAEVEYTREGARLGCYWADPLHDHHDGCPSEWAAEQQLRAAERAALDAIEILESGFDGKAALNRLLELVKPADRERIAREEAEWPGSSSKS